MNLLEIKEEFICCFCFATFLTCPTFCGCGEYKGIMSIQDYIDTYGELD